MFIKLKSSLCFVCKTICHRLYCSCDTGALKKVISVGFNVNNIGKSQVGFYTTLYKPPFGFTILYRDLPLYVFFFFYSVIWN